MLKVSNKGRYAVRALFDLAFHASDQPAQLRDIAERQRIPLRFLEQIFQDLKRARLVDSKRGPRGGYQLARSPDRICVGDVLRALDGPIALIAGLGEGNDASPETGVSGVRATRARSRVGSESATASAEGARAKASRGKGGGGIYASRLRASESDLRTDLRAVTDGVFTDLARDVERCFDAVTLEDLCTRGESLGLRRRARLLPTDYVI